MSNPTIPKYQLRVGDIDAADAIEVRCMCGSGPWRLTPRWLNDRHGRHEFVRWIVGALTCPGCGVLGVMTWSRIRARR
ncbi:hypothetical protein [Defluviimonas salinarum]|uniref:Zinc-finger of transposase IS204/IS1001/IS1096/IS1165 n=1 Tax=Defluviimonas salinarum TaxID=2992147 RepID=A0ABT3J5I5_9RHOB|nr:hypothetical protein [Defluviimonas salinarum]MCW3782922.1 hypothetical protein [Defluviimonas salinarum]